MSVTQPLLGGGGGGGNQPLMGEAPSSSSSASSTYDPSNIFKDDKHTINRRKDNHHDRREDGYQDIINNNNSNNNIGEEGNNNSASMTDKDQRFVPSGFAGFMFYFKLCSFWFSDCLVLGSLVTVVLPSQIASIVGDDQKEKYNGIIPSLGAFMCLIMTPVAGYLSDHTSGRFGRRRPFILSGAMIATLFLLGCMLFSSSSPFWSVWLVAVGLLGVQFGMAWSSGPYAGLLPELVPDEKFGVASGYMAFAGACGQLVGALATGFLITATPGSFLGAYIFLAGILLVGATPTLFVKERHMAYIQPASFESFIKSFYLPSNLYKNFYWILLTRFLFDMAIYAVLPFFQFFLHDIINIENPEFYSAMMVVIIVVSSIPSSLIAGPLSDRLGRKLMVYISTSIIALSMVVFVFLSFNPSIKFTLVIAGFVGMGYGAYQAVDWALALDVLPPNSDIAKDMGIWNIMFVLPQVLSPLISGFILSYFRNLGDLKQGYTVVFSMTAFYLLLATIFIRPVNIKTKQQLLQINAVE